MGTAVIDQLPNVVPATFQLNLTVLNVPSNAIEFRFAAASAVFRQKETGIHSAADGGGSGDAVEHIVIGFFSRVVDEQNGSVILIRDVFQQRQVPVIVCLGVIIFHSPNLLQRIEDDQHRIGMLGKKLDQLLLSSGVRIDNINIHKGSRVIVVDNPTTIVERTPVITVEDDGSSGSVRKYYRKETLEDVKVTCFAGVGLISKEYAAIINRAYGDGCEHSSFQIRMPYVKEMLHQVDFKDFLNRTGTMSIQDIWGKNHPVRNVDIFTEKEQFCLILAAAWNMHAELCAPGAAFRTAKKPPRRRGGS